MEGNRRKFRRYFSMHLWGGSASRNEEILKVALLLTAGGYPRLVAVNNFLLSRTEADWEVVVQKCEEPWIPCKNENICVGLAQSKQSCNFEDCFTAECALMWSGKKIKRNYLKIRSKTDENSYKMLVNSCQWGRRSLGTVSSVNSTILWHRIGLLCEEFTRIPTPPGKKVCRAGLDQNENMAACILWTTNI